MEMGVLAGFAISILTLDMTGYESRTGPWNIFKKKWKGVDPMRKPSKTKSDNLSARGVLHRKSAAKKPEVNSRWSRHKVTQVINLLVPPPSPNHFLPGPRSPPPPLPPPSPSVLSTCAQGLMGADVVCPRGHQVSGWAARGAQTVSIRQRRVPISVKVLHATCSPGHRQVAPSGRTSSDASPAD